MEKVESPTETSNVDNHARLANGSYRGSAVDGYDIDHELSNRDRTVYHNKEGKAVVAFRGTDLSGRDNKWRDLGADALIGLGLQHLSKRFQGAHKTTDQTLKKYGRENVSLTGHSLGGTQSLYVHKKYPDLNLETHAFNPGLSPLDVKRSKGAFHPQKLLTALGAGEFGNRVHIHAVRKDVVGALAPYLHGAKTHMYDAKIRGNPHALKNFLKGMS